MAKDYNEKYGVNAGARLLAEVYLALGDDEEAFAVYGSEYAKTIEKNARTLNSYAWFWAEKEKNLKSALKAAKKSLELEDSHLTWDTLSRIHWKMGQHKEAIAAEEKAQV